jgi:hypothetical protein
MRQATKSDAHAAAENLSPMGNILCHEEPVPIVLSAECQAIVLKLLVSTFFTGAFVVQVSVPLIS